MQAPIARAPARRAGRADADPEPRARPRSALGARVKSRPRPTAETRSSRPGRRRPRRRAEAADAEAHAPSQAMPGVGRARGARRETPRDGRPRSRSEAMPSSRRPSRAGRSRRCPITVGRMFADAIRRAGVRWAFTVPGESFLGLLEGLEAVGINVVATRHEGAAAFMAEAHAQLTGRPAAAIGTRAVGGVEPRDRHPHRLRRLEPDVRLRRPGRARRPRPRGLPGDRRRRDDRRPRQVVRRAHRRRVSGRRPPSDAVDQALNGRPGPGGAVASPRTCSTSRCRRRAAHCSSRVPPPRPTDDEVRDVLQLLASAERPRDPRRRGRPARPDLERPRPPRRAAARARRRVVAPRRRHLERPPAVPRHDRLRLAVDGSRAPRGRRTRCSSSAAGSARSPRTAGPYRRPAPAGRTSTSRRDRWRRELPPPALTVDLGCAAVPACRGRPARDARRPRRRVAPTPGPRATPRTARRGKRRPSSTRIPGPARASIPGKVVTTLRQLLPDDGDRHHRRRQLRDVGRARLPLPPARARSWAPTSGAMGYGLPAAIAAGLVHRDRAVVALVGDGGLGHDARRDRDGGPERAANDRPGLRQPALRHDPQLPGAAARGRGRGHRPRADRLRGGRTSPRARAASASRTTRASSRRSDRRSSPIDRRVIHLVVDRRWEGVDSRP